MPKHLKIFRIEEDSDTIILIPEGEGASFRYADLQMEANYVRSLVGKPKYKFLLIDLGDLNYFGSEFIGALITIAREKKNRRGKVAVCNAVEQMREVLENMSLFKLWPYFDTREEAMASLTAN